MTVNVAIPVLENMNKENSAILLLAYERECNVMFVTKFEFVGFSRHHLLLSNLVSKSVFIILESTGKCLLSIFEYEGPVNRLFILKLIGICWWFLYTYFNRFIVSLYTGLYLRLGVYL